MGRDTDLARQRLPEVDPVPRKQAAATLAGRFTRKKDYPQALALLTRIADQDDYPFETAADVFLALPKESPDRMTLFSQAQKNFAQFRSNPGFAGTDFSTMLLRIWRQLPPATVLSAVDDVLQAGKESDDQSQPFHMSLMTDKGSVSFNSAYQLRLFQVISILDELDHERAQSLLRENTETRSMLAQYPQGMQSFDPGMFQDHPGDPSKTTIQGVRYSLGKPDPSQAMIEGAEDQLAQQMNAISSEASSNPKQALADAMNLPASNPAGPPGFASPRAYVLMRIAKAAGPKIRRSRSLP